MQSVFCTAHPRLPVRPLTVESAQRGNNVRVASSRGCLVASSADAAIVSVSPVWHGRRTDRETFDGINRMNRMGTP